MMAIFIASFIFFLLVMAAMSLGYILKRKTLQGSCGGMTAMGIEKACDCQQPCDQRKDKLAKEAAQRKQSIQQRIL